MSDALLAPSLTLVGVPTFSAPDAQERRPPLTGTEPDAVLVGRARGDRQAFGLLYDRYCRLIYAYLYSRTQDAVLAEDLTSQTFFQALQAIGRYEERGVPFRSWLYRIAANALVSHARRHGHGETSDLDEARDVREPGPEPDAAFLRLESGLQLRAALERLPADQRTAITLRFGRDLRVREVAAEMGRTEGAVKMLLLRGLERLRRLLEDEGRAVP